MPRLNDELHKWMQTGASSTPVLLPKEERKKIIDARPRETNLRLARLEYEEGRHEAEKLERLARNIASLHGDWTRQANCHGSDPDLFYPGRGVSADPARAICQDCDVRLNCLEFALENNETVGIWGGTNDKERRAIRREWLRESAVAS